MVQPLNPNVVPPGPGGALKETQGTLYDKKK